MHPASLVSMILQDDVPGGLIAGLLGAYFFVLIAAYLFFGFCFMKIAQKTGTENGWWAFIPILNILLMLNIARKPLWWILLFLVPFVNIVIAIIVWIEICKARGKNPWILLGFLVPIIGPIGVLCYLAFTD